jgi:hypothetical protein
MCSSTSSTSTAIGWGFGGCSRCWTFPDPLLDSLNVGLLQHFGDSIIERAVDFLLADEICSAVVSQSD